MGKMKKSTKKFMSKKLDGAIKKRRERKHVLAKAKPVEKKAAPHKVEEVPSIVSRPRKMELELEGDERMDREFEAYLRDELEDFEEESSSSEEGDDEEEEGMEDGDDLDHAQELAALKETDPEFHKWLARNDPELLAFDDDGDEEDSDEARAGGTGLPSWMRRTNANAVRAGSRAFGSLCRQLSGNAEDTDAVEAEEEMAERVVRWGLEVGLVRASDRRTRLRLWKGVGLLLSGATQSWRALVLERLQQVEVWKKAGAAALRGVLKALLQRWSDANVAGEQAALNEVLRQAVLGLAHPHGPKVVRGAHAQLAMSSHLVSRPGAVGRLAAQAAAVAELHSLLPAESRHQLVYSSLRQLALQLRRLSAADSSTTRLSWALVLSLRVTTLAVHSSSGTELCYPAIHLLLGFVRAFPVVWLPAQLLLLDACLLLSQRVYVPVAAEAVRLLQALLTTSATSTGAAPTTPLPAAALRVNKAALAQRGPQQNTLVGRTLGVVERAALLVARHPSFPEWSAPMSRQLRYLSRYAPKNHSRAMHSLAQALDSNTRHVLQVRSRLGLTPRSGLEVAQQLAEEAGPWPLEAHFESLVTPPTDFLEERSTELEMEMEEDDDDEE